MIRLCFVCLGNICRSPTAHGIMEALVEQHGLAKAIEVDSAGTSAYHVGDRADERARATAQSRGFELRSIARQFRATDFDRFDYVLASDSSNLRDLRRLTRNQDDRSKLYLLRSFDPNSAADAGVPDPYYGGPRGFEDVFDICQAACEGLLQRVRSDHNI